jgi:release factor H-coupled RctB family protein
MEKAEVRLVASARNWIEGAAVQQLNKTAELAGMRLAVGLPDLHPGKGGPVGAAFVVEGRLYPALVGNDIGCGIGLWRTGLRARSLKREAWAERLRGLEGPWTGDCTRFLEERGAEACGIEDALGTVGGGNHFAELQVVEEGGELESDAVHLCVHSGSRGLGEAVLRRHTERHGAGGVEADSEEGARYVTGHDRARKWAAANRALVAGRVCERLRTECAGVLDVAHNMVERTQVEGRAAWIHRKGAATTEEGLVVIPGSRGARSYVVRPRAGAVESGCSIAHGAGRKWSRSECRGRLEKRFQARALTRTELGSEVICEDRELLYEEAPQAYKNIDVVVADLVEAGLVEVVAKLRPVVTYKVRR